MLKKIIILILLMPLYLAAQDSPEEYLRDYLRVRADTGGAESVLYLQGNVFSMIPGEKSMELFAYQGYTISRLETTETGYRLLGREVGLFLDHRTGRIMETWRNPFTQESLPVIQIWNDPVNQSFEYDANTLPYIRQFLPSTKLGESVVYHSELFPFYPHVLSQRLYGEYVQSEYFQSAEFYEYRTRLTDLADSLATSVPAEISFTWFAPWLPFMKMGDREGHLVFVCRGYKVASLAEIPELLRKTVMQHNPAFSRAPAVYSEPNMTAWSYFKKLTEEASDER